MSLRIHCPWCGERSLEEFTHGNVPVVPDSIAGEEARDFDRSFMHSNPEGPVVERWFHVFGCRRWISVERDTRDDSMLDSH